MIKNQYELEQEAIRIAKDAQEEFLNHGMDVYDYMHQSCDGHECVIYTYKAIELCQQCDTDDGEEQLHEIGYEAATFNEYATKLAYATLFNACIFAFDDLDGNLCEEEEQEKEVTIERTVLLTGKERDDYIASHWGMKA